MTKWKFFSILFTGGMIIGIPWWLISRASNGDKVASFVLGTVVSALLMGIGFALSYFQFRSQAQVESGRFQQNVRENLALMQQSQLLANQVTAQAVNAAQGILPPPEKNSDVWVDDAVFRFVDGDE